MFEDYKKYAAKIQASGQFDPDWYRAQYPDVDALQMDPVEHYLTYGILLRRAPNRSGEPILFELDSGYYSLVKSIEKTDRDEMDAQAYSNSTLKNFAFQKRLPIIDKVPQVSVSITSYNSEKTIELSVESLVHQSWPNLEVIICDDRSDDGTWRVLLELKKRYTKIIKLVRLERNSGTYLAKNVAIANAFGEYIMFQDSDDYSHPERIKVQIQPLIDNCNLMATRSKYCRFQETSGKVVPVSDLQSKFGLITIAVRRRAFEEIGHFDAVRKAGDDEWFQRLQHFYGKDSVLSQDVALYLAAFREGSLAADILNKSEDGSINQCLSPERREYEKIFKNRFDDRTKSMAWYKVSFPVFPKRPISQYPKSVEALEITSTPILAALCSIPTRERQLISVVSRILPQVDHLYIYLDKYTYVPDYLKETPNITVMRSQSQTLDHRDNAKFAPYKKLKCQYKDFYYLTCDDDIEYPFDYVQTMIDRLEKYGNRVIVGVHGVLYEEIVSSYFDKRVVYHFENTTISNDKLVNNLGTGTVAFHSDVFASIDPALWPQGGMVDILFSIEAYKNYIPMVCIEREQGWLRQQQMPSDDLTLYREFTKKDKEIVNQLCKHAPWGYRSIKQIVSVQPSAVRAKLLKMLPLFIDDISVHDAVRRISG